MATRFEVGKTYTAGWQNFKYTVIDRTKKTVVFADYYDHGETRFRRKIKTYRNGSEFVERANLSDYELPISSERVMDLEKVKG